MQTLEFKRHDSKLLIKCGANFGVDSFGRAKPHAGNSRLPQWGLTWLNQVQCSDQNLCLDDSEVLRNPPLRQAAKRYQ